MTMVHTATTNGFLFADLRDYTRFVETRGDDAAAALLGRYRALVREVVGQFGGAEIRTEGDSFYVVFPSASSAVLGGLAILAAADEATRTDPTRPLKIGIGVHAGETAETGEGPVGSAVNIAARVCAQARAGELLVTDTVRSLTRTRLTVRFAPRGSPGLKGIREPISLFAVQAPAESIQADPEAAGRWRVARMWTRIRARPAARWVVPGVAAAVVLIALVGATILLGSSKGSANPSGSGTAFGSPSSVPITSLPPIADVPFYRADDHRSSIYPGPGPVAEPQVAWQVQLDGAANFVPIVVDGKVIVGDLSGILRALDARTGEERWRFRTDNGGGFADSAAAADGLIFVADLAGTLYGLDAATGDKRWDKPLPNTWGQPLVADRLLYVGSSDGHASGFDPATGQPRWEWEGPAGTGIGVSVVSDGVAYIGGGGVLYAIRLVDNANAWPPVKTNTKEQSSAVLAGDTIFWAAAPGTGEVTGGELLAIDRATGMVRWRWSSPSGQHLNPSSIRDGIVYVIAEDDGVYALRDKGTAAEVVWHFEGRGNGRPASLVDDTLYLQRVEGPLIALSATDGHKLWQTPPGTAGTTNPVVTGGMIFQIDGESDIIRAWAEPAVIALLPSPAVGPSASPGATQPPDPFAVVASFPWAQTGIQVPVAMDVGPDGRLYVLHAKLDASNPLVTIIDPKTGRPISGGSWGRLGNGKGEFSLHGDDDNGPTGCIAVGPDHLVYVGDFENGRVEVFKSDGTFVRQIGSHGDGPGQLSRIIACDVGPDGSVYTLDHDTQYLSKFDAQGNFIWRMLADPVHPSNGGFQLHGFTIRPDGKIVGFTDETGRVLTIDPADGHIIGSWGTPGNAPGQMGGSGEPSVDGAGNIYVFQYVPSELQVFDARGRLLGGQYDVEGQSTTSRGGRDIFWPPPVFDPDGFGYTFGPDGLVKLKVTLPPG
jgi:outer membrane protein assembly factor BamB/class 3 adenylate cyclase